MRPAGDLWAQVGTEIRAKPGRRVNVLKVESHVDEQDLAKGYSTRFLQEGNDYADVVADARAQEIRVPSATSLLMRQRAKDAQAIRRRIREAFFAAAAAGPSEEEVPAREETPPAVLPRAQVLADSGHSLQRVGRFTRCEVCKQVVPARHRSRWLTEHPCTGPPRTATVRQQGDEVWIGGKAIHSTHAPHWNPEAGAWSCRACGAVAVVRAHRLADPCPGHAVSADAARRRQAVTEGRVPWQRDAASRTSPTAPGTHQPRAVPVPTSLPAGAPQETLTPAQARLAAMRARVNNKSLTTP